MRVLIFTHKSDIDGMGGAILAKLAFDDVTYVLCETFDLQNEIAKFYDDGSIYSYDKIFVTDMWLEEPMLSKVASDDKLNNKFLVFDHHESALKENFDKYAFTTIKVADEIGLCSGTSLFYYYLVSYNFIDTKNTAIREFSELTRKYDTWEWKTKYHEERPHELTLLFNVVGCNGYIELMCQKLKKLTDNFEFSELEEMLIKNKLKQVQEKLSFYAKKIYYKKVLGLKAGIIFIDYEYRNDLAEYLRQNGFDMDFVMLVALDYGTISYRNIKDNVNVRLIAEAFGGKGHDKAASSPIAEDKKQELIRILIKN